MKFIYVFGDEAKEKMCAMGYKLLKSNPSCGVHIFANRSELEFSSLGIPCVMSDTLTF